MAHLTQKRPGRAAEARGAGEKTRTRTHLHALEDGFEPSRALTAGRALTATLVPVKVREAADRGDHVDALVHHRDRSGAEPGALRLEVVKVHEHVDAVRLVEHGHGRAARDDTL